ncbi:hypothetical protein C5167_050929 [Papaver somniferum]|uniref:Transcription repressor n=1 Tax=Papaver somniferum TaxID=3469 RepID=A0A4Y7KU75_PAPSO|nr:transcription repressor OFP8-like [Papaver somniferum]RZC75445.1 hypothetical protein C5167_050929 [Papaver somniferum]
MESESKLKLKISKMFRSSFVSCRPKNVVDLMENPVFISQNRHDFQKIDQQSLILSPKTRPFPSICKPNKSLSESAEAEKRQSFLLQRKIKGITDDHTTEGVVAGGRKCPPVSPCSPSSNLFYNCYHDFYDNRERKTKPKKKQPVKKNIKKKPSLIRLSSSSSNGGWFSSEEEEDDDYYADVKDEYEENEDETERFFSSRSFSSSSSESQRRKKTHLRRKRAELRRRSRSGRDIIPESTTKKDVGLGIGESFAVVKRSSDPHSDFRTSMVEMIIQKQIFSAKDLEKLLQCFLSLNSSHHHRVIVQVFTEIWDALFSNYL